MTEEEIASWKRMLENSETVYLSKEAWEKFTAELESPPQACERLKRLLNEPSILD